MGVRGENDDGELVRDTPVGTTAAGASICFTRVGAFALEMDGNPALANCSGRSHAKCRGTMRTALGLREGVEASASSSEVMVVTVRPCASVGS